MLPLTLMMMMMGEATARPSHVDETGQDGCLGLGYCCTGRNLSCSSTGQTADSKEQTTTCFCDEECLTIGDCCLDYRAACRGETLHVMLHNNTNATQRGVEKHRTARTALIYS